MDFYGFPQHRERVETPVVVDRCVYGKQIPPTRGVFGRPNPLPRMEIEGVDVLQEIEVQRRMMIHPDES